MRAYESTCENICVNLFVFVLLVEGRLGFIKPGAGRSRYARTVSGQLPGVMSVKYQRWSRNLGPEQCKSIANNN